MSVLSGSVPPTSDATTTRKGKIKLANQLGGTADAPTVLVDGTTITVNGSQQLTLVSSGGTTQRTFAMFMG